MPPITGDPLFDAKVAISSCAVGKRPGFVLRSVLAEHRTDLLALVAYAGATVLFFWKIVVLGMVPAGYDLLTYFYPYKAYLSRLVGQGQLPLWNPLVFMGAPLLANIQAAVFYPLDLLFYLVPTADALRASVVIHVFLATTFTYLFGRASLGLSPMAAWVAGAIFGLGGFVGARVGQVNQLHAAVWLPMLMLCLQKGAESRGPGFWRLAALGGLVFSAQLLAGHTQEVYYSGWALGVYALYLAVLSGLTGWERLRPFAVLASITIVGMMVSGIQLLPSLELALQSYRSGGVPFGEAITFSVVPNELLQALLPLYSYTPYVETTGYTGIIALSLLPAAVASRRRPPYKLLFGALALMALVLSLGAATPIFGWLYRLAPGFDLFRAPGRWLFLYDFSIAMLAGIALDSIRRASEGGDLRKWLRDYALGLGAMVGASVLFRWWLGGQEQDLVFPAPRIVFMWGTMASLGMAASLITLAASRSRIAAGLMMALVLFDLYTASEPMEYNRPVDPSLYTAPRPIHAVLSGVEHARVLSLAGEGYTLADEGNLRAELAPSMTREEMDGYLKYTRLKEIVAPNVGMSVGLSSLDGYDGGLLPTRRYAELKRLLTQSKDYRPDATIRTEATVAPSSQLLGALGVGYLITNSGTGKLDPGWQEMEGWASGPLRVLRNENVLPRAYVVHASEVATGDGQALEMLQWEDLRHLVVLEDQVEFRPPLWPGRDDVAITRDGPNEVEVAASLEQPGFLVLSDSYYPGWKAYVDGREAGLLRADFNVRAVQLEAGVHRVRFAFEPASFRFGLAISILGLLLAAVALAPGLLKVGLRPPPVEAGRP